MIKEMDIVTILTILLFGLPVLIYGLRLKLFNKFLLNTLTNTFNKEIKSLCKLAGIDQWVSGFKNNPKTRRKEIVKAPKYEFVTSHIMRRSFASNYYGKIETPLLMNITGHSKESTFLTYIGTHQNKDALADLFMQQARVIW